MEQDNKKEGIRMKDNIIYKEEDTKVESIGDDIYRITSDASSDQPNNFDYVTIVLTIEELEGIYAAIRHYNAKREMGCCGNCKIMSKVCYLSPGATGYCHHYHRKG